MKHIGAADYCVKADECNDLRVFRRELSHMMFTWKMCRIYDALCKGGFSDRYFHHVPRGAYDLRLKF